MIVVDSSVWIDVLRNKGTSHVQLLLRLSGEGVIAVPDLVVVEVLQGSTSNKRFDEARWLLSLFPTIGTSDGALALQAARNYRMLRALGITVRSTIDTLIATRCILDGHELLHADRDFDGFERHLGLRVVPVPAS